MTRIQNRSFSQGWHHRVRLHFCLCHFGHRALSPLADEATGRDASSGRISADKIRCCFLLRDVETCWNQNKIRGIIWCHSHVRHVPHKMNQNDEPKWRYHHPVDNYFELIHQESSKQPIKFSMCSRSKHGFSPNMMNKHVQKGFQWTWLRTWKCHEIRPLPNAQGWL